jgi:hypothetical protein
LHCTSSTIVSRSRWFIVAFKYIMYTKKRNRWNRYLIVGGRVPTISFTYCFTDGKNVAQLCARCSFGVSSVEKVNYTTWKTVNGWNTTFFHWTTRRFVSNPNFSSDDQSVDILYFGPSARAWIAAVSIIEEHLISGKITCLIRLKSKTQVCVQTANT